MIYPNTDYTGHIYRAYGGVSCHGAVGPLLQVVPWTIATAMFVAMDGCPGPIMAATIDNTCLIWISNALNNLYIRHRQSSLRLRTCLPVVVTELQNVMLAKTW